MAKTMNDDEKALNEVLTKEAPDTSPDKLFGRHKNKIGADGKIGDEWAKKGADLLLNYKNQLASEHERLIENERWYQLQNWREMDKDGARTGTERQSTSAWTLNAIANKHADAMDNYPQPNVLPREKSDENAAKALSAIIPCILERRDYEETYSNMWWYKLKSGTGCIKVFWNQDLENGLGDIDITKVDLLSLYYEATVNDIQDSANIFEVYLVDKEALKEEYPFIENPDTTKEFYGERRYDQINGISTDFTDEKVEVVDWYYKKKVGSRTVVHYIKFTHGAILYASENDQRYADTGYYESGMYPYDFDRMYIKEHSPLGFGVIDVCRSPQEYIDRMNDVFLKNALVNSRPRYFVNEGMGINLDDFTDLSKDIVKYNGNIEDIKPIEASVLPPIYVTMLNNKIDELKETVGNRDFSQGGTTSGVTAASAIASLMEAGSKLSRDNIKASYRSFTRICLKIIELIRQFYDVTRCFRITGEDGTQQYQEFNNTMMQDKRTVGNEVFERLPIYDIKVSAQKSNPFSVVSQNELALQFYQLGFFNPQMADQSLACIDMLEFEGKQKIMQKIQQNGTLAQQLQAAMQQIAQLQAIITGQTQPTPDASQPMPQDNTQGLRQMENNSLGRAVRDSKNAQVNRAKESAQKAATPRAK